MQITEPVRTSGRSINMGETLKLLAIDLGASSGRVMLGRYDGDTLSIEEIHRFDNTPVQIAGHLYWDVPRLFHEMKQGIQKAYREHGQLESISIDTWGVDYGFIDYQGQLLYSPHHYRDQRVAANRSGLEALLTPEEQFTLTGNQPSIINTVYQLYSDLQANSSLPATVDKILMMPDLFHYLFTGVAVGENSIFSTSGLCDPITGLPSAEVFSKLDIPLAFIPQLVSAGTVIGEILPDVQKELGAGPIKVIACASHDTASAVASIPYRDKSAAAFISCGTWSLVGMETAGPVTDERSFHYGFTNESSYGNTNRLQKNITGLWILQETRRIWAEAGNEISYKDMARLAGTLDHKVAVIDPNDPLFSTPGDMPQRIKDYCRRTGQQEPQTGAEMIRVILESLALSYSRSIDELEELTGQKIHIIHMVGGGIQNELLCQLTADTTGREVLAGPVEASAIGNILVQLIALNKLDLLQAKDKVRQSFEYRSYMPSLSK